jgi:spore maturation protein CgeB
MRFVMFYHSLVSDWNHGNAHFLRGVAAELLERGHEVAIYEPRAEDGWSLRHLLQDQGSSAIDDFHAAYPQLFSCFYDPQRIDLARALSGADVVIVHEWVDQELANAIVAHHRRWPHYRLLFHDTHHRVVSDPEHLERFALDGFDAILAFGASLAARYRQLGWGRKVYVWHEAADTSVFYPRPRPLVPEGELVWVGNWGDGERAAELEEFLIGPVRRLGLRARVHGVRYPEEARRALASAGIEYGGWIPNFAVPELFSRYVCTVHVPRRQYARELPGIPTIRPFEALACGIPLVSAPWQDSEGLFVAGRDYLVARNGEEMTTHLAALISFPGRAHALAAAGRRRIEAAHTCAHRVDELFDILAEIGAEAEGTTSEAGQELALT